MEDTHVWTLDVASGARRELGADDRQPAGPAAVVARRRSSLYFTVQSRGSVGLYRLPAAGGAAERVGPALDARGSVGAFAVGEGRLGRRRDDDAVGAGRALRCSRPAAARFAP